MAIGMSISLAGVAPIGLAAEDAPGASGAAPPQGEAPGADEALAAITQGELASFVEKAVESYTGREMSIGRLDVDLGWEVVEVRAEDVRLANAGWAKAEPMLSLGSMTVRIQPADLLAGRVVIPLVEISEAKLVHAVNESGKSNLPLPQDGEESAGGFDPSSLPLIRKLEMDDVEVVHRNLKTGVDARLLLTTASYAAPDGEAMSLAADGEYQGLPLKIDATAGTWQALTEATDEAFPLDLKASLGALSAKASGTIAEPVALRGVDVTIRIDGDEVPEVYPLARIFAAPTPTFDISGRLDSARRGEAGTAWSLSDIDARLGSTRMSGNLKLVTAGERPHLGGTLRADPFRLDDVTAFFSEPEQGGEPEEKDADGRVLPDSELPFSALHQLDADLDLRLVDVRAAGATLDVLTADLTLDDGTLRLQPLRAERGEAQVTAFASLYSKAQPVQTDLKVDLSRLSLERIIGDVPLASVPVTGRLGGNVELGMSGDTLAEMLGSADGSIFLAMDDGQLSGLLIELLGLDVTEALGLAVTEGDDDAAVPIRCALTQFDADAGTLDVQHFVIDTADTLIRADGTVGLGKETLDLEIVPHPKDFSLLSLRSPIGIQGTFAQPEIFTDPVGLGVESTADKVINALLTPIVGLLPPIDAGLGADSRCRELVEQARSE